ncbi:MAG: DMT family transporter [Bradyrhizobiaceae bacterium]|nr:DMT family transporter [Bradyrhizobiaceae bacterium]
MPHKRENLAIYAAPALFVVLWASGFVGAKFGMPYVEPLTFLTLRMGAVVFLLAILAFITRPTWPDLAGFKHSIVAGLLVHGFYLGGVFISIDRRLPAGLSALVVSLQPVLTSTIANRYLGERVVARQWLGLALGIGGVYLVVADKTVAGEATAIGWIAALCALIAITVGTLYQKRFGGGIDWRAALIIQYSSAGVLFAVGSLLFENQRIEWTIELIGALAWLVLVLSLGAVWLLYFLIRRTAATRVTSLFYLTPAATALMAWALLGEHLGMLALIGMAVCVVGVFLVNWRAA